MTGRFSKQSSNNVHYKTRYSNHSNYDVEGNVGAATEDQHEIIHIIDNMTMLRTPVKQSNEKPLLNFKDNETASFTFDGNPDYRSNFKGNNEGLPNDITESKKTERAIQP